MGKSHSTESKKIVVSGKGVKDIEKDTNSYLLKNAKQLDFLDASNNKITSFPASILEYLTSNVSLQNTLTHVDLSKNKLDNLPQEIFHCGRFVDGSRVDIL